MRVNHLSASPIYFLPYLSAGQVGAQVLQLPFFHGIVEGLPPEIQALVCTGDLQGVRLGVDVDGFPQLLGEQVAEELVVLLEMLSISPSKTGIVLTGDYFSAPSADSRGVSGDVRTVWNAFAAHFHWVVGVLGNHDEIGTSMADRAAFQQCPNLHLLDGNAIELDRLRLAGIGGIIGNSSKKLRRSSGDYLATLTRLTRVKPDIVILHPSPEMKALGLPGAEELGDVYYRQAQPLTVCGHVNWLSALAEIPNGNQVLNVDSRVVILTAL